MPQVQISGLADSLPSHQSQLVQAINQAFAQATGLTADKIIYRCYPLSTENFICPGRSSRYTVIEISLFAGRSIDTTKQLITAIFTHIQQQLGWETHEIEIILTEIPSHQWGLRGITGDEL